MLKKRIIIPLTGAVASVAASSAFATTSSDAVDTAISDGQTLVGAIALKRAGITDFRWHDLRHTWASWHIQNGTPLHVLQELGGWADSSMVLRYAHLSSEHLQSYAGNAGVVTNLLHSQQSAKRQA